MAMVVKNLAAVKDATLSAHSLSYISKLLSAAENSQRPFVVAHRHTGVGPTGYSTTVFDVLSYHLYRAVHPVSVRGWLEAITAERANLKLLANDEVMHLQVLEDERADSVAWAA